MMDALSKQLYQAPIFAEDTDIIYLHFCDLNALGLTVTFLPFLWLNVGFSHFQFCQFFGGEVFCVCQPPKKRVLDKLNRERPSCCIVWVISSAFFMANTLLILPLISKVTTHSTQSTGIYVSKYVCCVKPSICKPMHNVN